MADNRLSIVATLNVGASVGELNKKIRELSKHPSLQKIKLKVDIDPKILQTLQQFNANLGKINQTMGQQSSVTEQASKASESNINAVKSESNAYNELARSADNATRKIKEFYDAEDLNGKRRLNRRETTTGSRFNSITGIEAYNEDGSIVDKGAIRNINSEAYREAEKNFDNFAKNTQARIKEINKAIGNNNKLTRELKEQFKSLNVESSKTDFSSFENKLKSLETYAKTEVKAMKELDDITSNIGKRTSQDQIADIQKRADLEQKVKLEAHELEKKARQEMDNALLETQRKRVQFERDWNTNQQKAIYENHEREIKMLDDAHRMNFEFDKKRNQQRFINEQKFARMQQDTFNKIETARMKFGHHKGVNEQLDAALFNARNIKVTDDYNNALRNVNATVAKTTTGLKAARVESLTFAEGFRTAMVKFPIWMAAATARYCGAINYRCKTL